MVRPHRVRLEPANGDSVLRGRVVGLTYLGDLLQYEVDLGGARLIAEQASSGVGAAFTSGDEVQVSWHPGDGTAFNRA